MMRPSSLAASILAPALAIVASIQLARAEVPPFRSLNDLPRNWSGEAGDLFNRVSASLRLGKAIEKGRVGDDRSYRVEYEVKGTLTIGGRSFRINGARVWVSEMSSNSAEVIWMLEGDALISNLRTIVRHRGEQRDYQLVDYRGDGGPAERRFVLRAPEGERR